MSALTLEELAETVRQINDDPRFMAWKTEQEAKRKAEREEAAERCMDQQRELNERVRQYNEAHANQNGK